jgi:exosome complex exonuclease RRP6
MDSSQDFKSMQDKIQAALVKTTRLSNQVAAEDLSFQRSSNPAADEQLDETSERLLALSTSLLKSATKGTQIKPAILEDADDVDAQWSRVVDVIDTLLEKADTCLDEYTGLVKRKTAPTEEIVRFAIMNVTVGKKNANRSFRDRCLRSPSHSMPLNPPCAEPTS